MWCCVRSNTGMSPGWFVEKVVVQVNTTACRHHGSSLECVSLRCPAVSQNLASRMKWTFMVNRWFDRDDGDGAIERLLVPEVPEAHALPDV